MKIMSKSLYEVIGEAVTASEEVLPSGLDSDLRRLSDKLKNANRAKNEEAVEKLLGQYSLMRSRLKDATGGVVIAQVFDDYIDELNS